MIGASGPVSLRDTWFGARLPEAAIARLEPHVRTASYEAGAEILREGDPTMALGIVARGRVALRLRVPERGDDHDPDGRAGRHHRLVGGRPAASGDLDGRRARSRASLLLLDGAELRAELDADPELAAAVYRSLLEAMAHRLTARACSCSTCSPSTGTNRGDRDRPPPPSCRAPSSTACSTCSTPTAAGSSARRSARARSSTTRSPAPPTCPAGWTATQAPGPYRLEPTGTDRAVRLRRRPDRVEARDVPAARARSRSVAASTARSRSRTPCPDAAGRRLPRRPRLRDRGPPASRTRSWRRGPAVDRDYARPARVRARHRRRVRRRPRRPASAPRWAPGPRSRAASTSP